MATYNNCQNKALRAEEKGLLTITTASLKFGIPKYFLQRLIREKKLTMVEFEKIRCIRLVELEKFLQGGNK